MRITSLIILFIALFFKGPAQSTTSYGFARAEFSKSTNKWIASQKEKAYKGEVQAAENLAMFFDAFKGYNLEAFEFAVIGDKLGSVKSSFVLGHFYETDNFTQRKNLDSARYYYSKAGNAGLPRAMFKTGQRLELSVPVTDKPELSEFETRKYNSALAWYQKAAESGFPNAAYKAEQLSIALNNPLVNGIKAYERGDYPEAFKLFKAGADILGDYNCKYGLASMYYEGLATEKDLYTAQKMYAAAGNHGNAAASYWAGVLSWTVYKDSKTGYDFLDQAVKQGYPKAKEYIEFMTATINRNIAVRQAEKEAFWKSYNEKQRKEAEEYHPIVDIKIPASNVQWGTNKSYSELQKEHEDALRAASEKTFERSQKQYYKP